MRSEEKEYFPDQPPQIHSIVPLSEPIHVRILHEGLDARLSNTALMQVTETLGRRVMIKFCPEVYVNYRGQWRYKHMREVNIMVSCASAAEARAVISALQGFCAALEGKHLVSSAQSAPDSRDNTDKSADK